MPSQPFFSLVRFSRVWQGPSCSLDRPVFVKSTPSCHPEFRHISAGVCSARRHTPNQRLSAQQGAGELVRESNSALGLLHNDYPRLQSAAERLGTWPKLTQPSPDSKWVLRHEDTECGWHGGHSEGSSVPSRFQVPPLPQPPPLPVGGEALAPGEGFFEGNRTHAETHLICLRLLPLPPKRHRQKVACVGVFGWGEGLWCWKGSPKRRFDPPHLRFLFH